MIKLSSFSLQESVVFFHNGKVIGGVTEAEKFLHDEFQYANSRPMELFEAMAEEAYRIHFASAAERDVVYFDVTIDNTITGTVAKCKALICCLSAGTAITYIALVFPRITPYR